MATLYITEFNSQGTDYNGHELASPMWPSNTSQTIGITASSASSSGFANGTGLIRLHSDTTCSYTIGLTPTATTIGPRLAANQTEYHAVPANKAWKVAVISNT